MECAHLDVECALAENRVVRGLASGGHAAWQDRLACQLPVHLCAVGQGMYRESAVQLQQVLISMTKHLRNHDVQALTVYRLGYRPCVPFHSPPFGQACGHIEHHEKCRLDCLYLAHNILNLRTAKASRCMLALSPAGIALSNELTNPPRPCSMLVALCPT